MKGIVRDMIFVVVLGIFGVAGGLGVASILNAIAIPSYIDLLLTLKEKADIEAMRTGFLSFLGANINTVIVIIVIFTVIAFVLVLCELNPNFLSLRRPEVKKKKALVAVLGGIVLFFLLSLSMARMPLAIFSGIFPASLPDTDMAQGFIMVIISGALWLLVGQMGWAGDLTAWRPGGGVTMSRWARIAVTFFMGAACGGIAFYFFLLFNWSFNKYFLLVSEVLGGSGEPTLHGWQLLSNAIMVMLGFSFAIIAGFVTVLAPRQMTIKARLVRLIIPAILLAIYTPIIAGTYRDAAQRYDLNKKNIAEAVGVPEKGQASKTVVLFLPEKPAIQEWRMEAAGNGLMVYNNTYALTPENIKKIEDYLARHKDGSIFFYAGRDAVMKGYYKLWETEKGNGQMFGNAASQMLARMVLLKRLSSLPVTAENEAYLRSFTDETKWYAGKTSSLRIAEAFMHFGRADESRAWSDKAKAKGADPAKSKSLSEPALTNASVTGTLKMNGAPLAGKKVALFLYRPKMTQLDPQYFSGFPIDAKTTDAAGKFEFANLGKGEYVLAVMVEKEEVPFKAPAGGLSVENAPVVIAVDAAAPSKNLGDINLVVQK